MNVLSVVKSHIEKTTMYRTVLYSLMALTAWSLVFSVIGILDYFVVAMVVQLLILLIVGYGADRLFAAVFKVTPNPESIFVTSFILYFLLIPSGTVQSFIVAAIAAMVAAASKYLLVWRGKHITNPAAMGAVIIGLTGIGFAGWWVATLSLLPFVLIAGAIVLYKTRRYDMVAIYIVVSLVMISAIALMQDRFTLGLLWQAIVSYPILFLAFFMLTEPQTLAPKRQQRNGVAAGVAILAHCQVAIGAVSMTPEIALVVGNIVSAAFTKTRGFRLMLTSRKKLPGDQVEYVFSTDRELKFEAGQYMELQVPHKKIDARGIRRMFTIASRPGTDSIRLITRHPQPGSSFKNRLAELPVGRVLRVCGIWGDFVLPRDSSEKLLMIAGGVGITPFLSQLEWLSDQNETRDIVLIYGVRNKEDAIRLRGNETGIRVIIHEGPLSQQDIRGYAKDIHQRTVYISGPPVMVDAVSRDVRQLGAARVHRDFFAGY